MLRLLSIFILFYFHFVIQNNIISNIYIFAILHIAHPHERMNICISA